MSEPSLNWNREFFNGTWDIARQMGSNGDWLFYEIEGDRFGVFGVAFSEVERRAYIRFTFDSPKRPSGATLIELMRRVRFSMDVRDELSFGPQVEYDEAGSAIVLRLNTFVIAGESLNDALSVLFPKMYNAVGAVLANELPEH